MLQKQKLSPRHRLNRWIDYLDTFDRLGWRTATKLVHQGLIQEKNILNIKRTFPYYVDMNVFMDALEMHDTITANMITLARHYYPQELGVKEEDMSKESKQLKMLEDDLTRGLRAIQENITASKIAVSPERRNYADLLVYLMHFNRILTSRHYEAIAEAWRMTEDNFIKNYIYVILSKSGLYPKSKEESKIEIKTKDDGLDI